MSEHTPTPEGEAAAPAQKDHGRAGRNLPVAVGVGAGLLVMIAASLIFVKELFALVAVVALWIGVGEMAKAMSARGIRIEQWPILAAVPIVGVVAFVFGPVAHLAVFGLLVLVILVWRLTRGVDNYVRDTTGSILVAAYLPLMLGFAILTLAVDEGNAVINEGAALIIVYVLLTVGSDIGGYIAGVLFGKHPMAPAISPKKSWEGFAGSLLLQMVGGYLLFEFLLNEPGWMGLVIGAVMTFTATVGDFIESAMKRDLGVKDMGDIVPGHGGIMDRLDSLIPNAFVSWALFTLFLGM